MLPKFFFVALAPSTPNLVRLREINLHPMKSLSPLIPAAEVNPLLMRSAVVLVDARGGTDAQQRYQQGHLEDAIFFDLETELSEKGDPSHGGRHPLPHPSAFGALLGQKGIDRDNHILVYDDKSGANAAARFWWMMRALGHEKIQVIDGGISALQQAGHRLVPGQPVERRAKSTYSATGWILPQADMAMVKNVRLKHDWLVIDVREDFRFRGEREPIDIVAGHIPGAVNIPYVNSLRADGTFRSLSELGESYRAAIGERASENLIVHCGSGVTACHSILAMASAGLPTPRLYVGSWSEWSRNENPMATGKVD